VNIENLEYYNRLIITSTPEGLKTCLNLVPEIEHKLHLDDKTSFALRTILIESVTNAICHGNHYDKNLKAIITIKISNKQIFVEVEDQGEGFDASLIPSPIDKDNITLETGRGVFFIRAFSDSFKTIGKGNIVNIVINR
jgi:anti-sigma regulatory factor (Ser/Thr protein kinase)